jgi:hypothetical protein
VLPEVLQVVLSGAQVPLVQVPPQHVAPVAHEPLSGVHAVAPQEPFTHVRLQQSVALAQLLPAVLQFPGPTPATHFFAVGSQTLEQQSVFAAQVWPAVAHKPPSGTPTVPPVSPVLPLPSTLAAEPSASAPPSSATTAFGPSSEPHPTNIAALNALNVQTQRSARRHMMTSNEVRTVYRTVQW